MIMSKRFNLAFTADLLNFVQQVMQSSLQKKERVIAIVSSLHKQGDRENNSELFFWKYLETFRLCAIR